MPASLTISQCKEVTFGKPVPGHDEDGVRNWTRTLSFKLAEGGSFSIDVTGYRPEFLMTPSEKALVNLAVSEVENLQPQL